MFLRKPRVVQIDDELRVSIATELKERIEKGIVQKQGKNIYSPNVVLSEEQLDKLSVLAQKVQKDKCIEKNLDMLNMTGLLLFMLLSRSKANIEEKDLAWLEESTDLGDFHGFFRDANVKAIFVRSIVSNQDDNIGHTAQALRFLH